MPGYDFRTCRLYVDAPLAEGAAVALERGQSHYLTTVLRQKAGDRVLAFNGRDGEWNATIDIARRAASLRVDTRTRTQTIPADLHYLFAPLKAARLDYMVQKAVEMGAAALQPVMTRFTQASRVNTERMRANVVEAAEQCGILSVAGVAEPLNLVKYLDQRVAARLLIFCDEAAEVADPVAALTGARDRAAAGIDVLIGPEGGFAEEERALLLKQGNILRLALGPRIMRADTAAVAALAMVQATLGDWRPGGEPLPEPAAG